MEESLERGTRWAAFEPSDEALWSKVRIKVDAFLMHLFRQGAFQGVKPADACFVHCDRTTLTESDLRERRLVLEVGFAPLKPAEFIVLRIRQRTAPPSP